MRRLTSDELPQVSGGTFVNEFEPTFPESGIGEASVDDTEEDDDEDEPDVVVDVDIEYERTDISEFLTDEEELALASGELSDEEVQILLDRTNGNSEASGVWLGFTQDADGNWRGTFYDSPNSRDQANFSYIVSEVWFENLEFQSALASAATELGLSLRTFEFDMVAAIQGAGPNATPMQVAQYILENRVALSATLQQQAQELADFIAEYGYNPLEDDGGNENDESEEDDNEDDETEEYDPEVDDEDDGDSGASVHVMSEEEYEEYLEELEEEL